MAALLLFLAVACRAQSLGDVAREQKAKKATTSASSDKHVITNEDIHPGASSAGASQDQGSSGSGSAAKPSRSFPSSSKGSKPSAEEVKETIKAQKAVVADLESQMKDVQAQLDIWKARDCRAWVHQDGKSACDIPPELNSQKRRLDAELEQERKTLEEMQEKARRMGYGNSVYEPD